jgi:hypothetical protein
VDSISVLQQNPTEVGSIHRDNTCIRTPDPTQGRIYKRTTTSTITRSLCGLVVRVPGYRLGDPGFHSWRYQIFGEVEGLERGPLSLVRITEELLERTVAAPV